MMKNESNVLRPVLTVPVYVDFKNYFTFAKKITATGHRKCYVDIF